MSAIWRDCQDPDPIRPLQTAAFRIVESQEQVATMALVDTADEQYVLEQLLDRTKPKPPAGYEAYHYLIWTPFRYPPLPYGSRFGHPTQAGIFYASFTPETALAECAYYRFVLLSGLSVALPNNRLTTEYTSFRVEVGTTRGVFLDRTPFTRYASAIRDPKSYDASQPLGTAMREARAEAFTYPSARDEQARANVGVFSLAAIQSRKPAELRQWICATTADTVSFIELHMNNPPHSYVLSQFMIDGVLPSPAC